MQKFKVMTYLEKLFSAELDHEAGRLVVSEELSFQFDLDVAEIRNRYGSSRVFVYCDFNPASGTVLVGVYPDQPKSLSPERSAYLTKRQNENYVPLLVALLPELSTKWTDPGVRVITTSSVGAWGGVKRSIQVVATTNEDGDPDLDYVRSNEGRVGWLLSPDTIKNVQIVRV